MGVLETDPDDFDPVDLVVYECRGDRLPPHEPSWPGFIGLWPEPPYYYLFFDRDASAQVEEWIGTLPGWKLSGSYRLAYEQWQQISRSRQKAGPFVILAGRGMEEEGAGEGIPIRLEPGVVFGTGLHPTTRGCLETLAALFETGAFDRVVDLGTGTGILAAACTLLGASRVMALDCNLLAVRAARKNLRMNGGENATHFLVADDLGVLNAPSDLLVMNIEWPCLKRVLAGEAWRRYPTVLASGFLETQWEEFETLIPPAFRVDRREIIEGWCTVVLRRRL